MSRRDDAGDASADDAEPVAHDDPRLHLPVAVSSLRDHFARATHIDEVEDERLLRLLEASRASRRRLRWGCLWAWSVPIAFGALGGLGSLAWLLALGVSLVSLTVVAAIAGFLVHERALLAAGADLGLSPELARLIEAELAITGDLVSEAPGVESDRERLQQLRDKVRARQRSRASMTEREEQLDRRWTQRRSSVEAPPTPAEVPRDRRLGREDDDEDLDDVNLNDEDGTT